ncbi:MAG: hypothetical protein LBB09_00815 [Rickettsiales bacterium]|nr:hypothetical protein [Rickettsiales bacterium]
MRKDDTKFNYDQNEIANEEKALERVRLELGNGQLSERETLTRLVEERFHEINLSFAKDKIDMNPAAAIINDVTRNFFIKILEKLYLITLMTNNAEILKACQGLSDIEKDMMNSILKKGGLDADKALCPGAKNCLMITNESKLEKEKELAKSLTKTLRIDEDEKKFFDEQLNIAFSKEIRTETLKPDDYIKEQIKRGDIVEETQAIEILVKAEENLTNFLDSKEKTEELEEGEEKEEEEGPKEKEKLEKGRLETKIKDKKNELLCSFVIAQLSTANEEMGEKNYETIDESFVKKVLENRKPRVTGSISESNFNNSFEESNEEDADENEKIAAEIVQKIHRECALSKSSASSMSSTSKSDMFAPSSSMSSKSKSDMFAPFSSMSSMSKSSMFVSPNASHIMSNSVLFSSNLEDTIHESNESSTRILKSFDPYK